eukprot:m.99116 g.99116  ORF g.99116 m.99116 type:complete len:244 (+) comp14026_c1_seq2:108-839(+)
MAAAERLNLCELPSDVLGLVIGFLDKPAVMALSKTCLMFQELCFSENVLAGQLKQLYPLPQTQTILFAHARTRKEAFADFELRLYSAGINHGPRDWGVPTQPSYPTFGQTGRLICGNASFSIRRVDALEGLPIKKVSVGGYHSCVLTTDGRCFSFGSSTFGQIGQGSHISSAEPRQLALPERIIEVILGGHGMFLWERGTTLSLSSRFTFYEQGSFFLSRGNYFLTLQTSKHCAFSLHLRANT